MSDYVRMHMGWGIYPSWPPPLLGDDLYLWSAQCYMVYEALTPPADYVAIAEGFFNVWAPVLNAILPSNCVVDGCAAGNALTAWEHPDFPDGRFNAPDPPRADGGVPGPITETVRIMKTGSDLSRGSLAVGPLPLATGPTLGGIVKEYTMRSRIDITHAAVIALRDLCKQTITNDLGIFVPVIWHQATGTASAVSYAIPCEKIGIYRKRANPRVWHTY